ncbi:MAG: DUF1844 domain-containing protein [Desulfosalsimonadaceae bacterium]
MSGEQHQDENRESLKNNPNGDPSVSLPEISFSTFIMSLNSSALVHLGLEADPSTGERVPNLPFAKQTIDILAMLEKKTNGNLNNEEQQLLTNILYELRLMYVKQKKGGSA